jgi:chromate transporter
MIYLKLFWEFALIGLFSFGGGYAMIPMLQKTVSEYGWLTAEQLSRIIVIAEMTPGPIAVNAATFVGYNTGGFLGGIVATLGVALPSMLIIFLVSRLFIKYKSHPDKIMAFYGIRPVITGMVIAASFVIAKTALFTEKTVAVFSGLFKEPVHAVSIRAVVIMVLALIVQLRYKINPILTLLLGGAAGFIVYYVF